MLLEVENVLFQVVKLLVEVMVFDRLKVKVLM